MCDADGFEGVTMPFDDPVQPNAERAHPLSRPDFRPPVAQSGGRRIASGFSLLELVVTIAVIAVIVASSIPLAKRLQANNLRVVSLKNLVVLGEAQACYATDWNDRQWSIAPRDLGTTNGNCSVYVATKSCPPQALLGWSSSGVIWGYFLGSFGLCTGTGNPGSCGNISIYRPLNFTGPDAGFGSFRIPNLRGMQEYVGLKFYEKEWYSELDTVNWSKADDYFPLPDQFTSNGFDITFSAYCLSPAAMYHPGVMRRPSNGGFQSPDAGFADSYRAPSLSECLHPDLKTRMVEHSWLVNPPSPSNPAWSVPEPWYFNHGITSRPGTLFFDGSVQEMTMKQAVADDEAMRRSTNFVDGLWHRGTPLGANGYFGNLASDDTRNSFHVLTTDGILGRDFLNRRPGRTFE
jgi:prepilin-type N-terminal cleavage/methylation domain-containing protein